MNKHEEWREDFKKSWEKALGTKLKEHELLALYLKLCDPYGRWTRETIDTEKEFACDSCVPNLLDFIIGKMVTSLSQPEKLAKQIEEHLLGCESCVRLSDKIESSLILFERMRHEEREVLHSAYRNMHSFSS